MMNVWLNDGDLMNVWLNDNDLMNFWLNDDDLMNALWLVILITSHKMRFLIIHYLINYRIDLVILTKFFKIGVKIFKQN